MIPITRLSVGRKEAAAAAAAVRSGWLSAGKRGQQFEAMVAEYVGARHGIAVSSCTTGLHLALVVAGVKPGDEVICPSFSFIASANAIVHAGARPVFVEIDERTLNIDPRRIEEAITPRTTAIMPVSQIGLAADIPAVLEIARRRGLKVVEDAAPSLGATVGDRRIGGLSDFTCFSFDARKILTTGEGGMITTNDDAGAERLRRLRAHAASVSTFARHASNSIVPEEYPEIGYNHKLTDIQAAVGIVQMQRIETLIAKRRRLARRYDALLAGDGRIVTPFQPPAYRHIYQCYSIRLRTKKTQLDVMNAMVARGVATRRIMAIHLEPVYRRLYPGVSLPITEQVATESIQLPIFPTLTVAEQDVVVEELKRALD